MIQIKKKYSIIFVQTLFELGKYLNATKDLILTLSVEKPLALQSYVDASYSVHHDGKSLSGGYTTLGHGAIRASSRKQAIVSNSRTESTRVLLS